MICNKSLQEIWRERFKEDWTSFGNTFADQMSLATDSAFGFGSAVAFEKQLIGALGRRLLIPINLIVDYIINGDKAPDVVGTLVSNSTGALISEGSAFLIESAAVAEFAPFIPPLAAAMSTAAGIIAGVAAATLAGLGLR